MYCAACNKDEMKNRYKEDNFTIECLECSFCGFALASEFKNKYEEDQMLLRWKRMFGDNPISLKGVKKPSIQLFDFGDLREDLREPMIESCKEMNLYCYSCDRAKIPVAGTTGGYCRNTDCDRYNVVDPIEDSAEQH